MPVPVCQPLYSKVKVKVKLLSRVQLFATPQTVAYQASLSMRFSRQEYWNGLPFPSPGDLPNPEIEPRYPAMQAVLYYKLKKCFVIFCVCLFFIHYLCGKYYKCIIVQYQSTVLAGYLG